MQYAMPTSSKKVFFARQVHPCIPKAVFHARSTVNFFFCYTSTGLLTLLDIFVTLWHCFGQGCGTKVSKMRKFLIYNIVKYIVALFE